MFEQIPQTSINEREQERLKNWKKNKIFEKTLEKTDKFPLFSFYDGPPFATGLPHYGHLLAGTIKDVVPRYKTMKGYHVPRRFGWDCHGLPVENEIEKSHGLKGAAAIEEFGIANFNEACREIVLRYSAEWEGTVERMGRWVDFSNTYRTMDVSFMESVWWVFKQLFDQGLVYQGFKVMPFSAKLGTPLSNFEATQNYKEVDDPALTVAFVLKEDPDTAILAWTTTPWTLISNLALTVGSEITYVKVLDKKSQKKYILAKDRLAAYYSKEEEYTIVETLSGKDLVGMRYQPILPYFVEQAELGAFQVISGDFVSTDNGTGIVHTAPAFGEDDFYACQKAKIPIVCPVDRNGQFTEQVPEYAGQFVKDADKSIIKRLKEQESVVHHGTCRHRYPYCWRSDTPLIYRAMKTWFVAVEKIKDRLLAANDQIHWTPEHLQQGRFGKWLEQARDWAISRNRYWGTPIPIWQSECGKTLVVGSIAELTELTGKKLTDLHRHYIDDLTIEKEGIIYRRIPEVFDCWFESGSMPYAQNHYPFENKESTEKGFPGDFIAEGLDQTRGWFYTLTVLSVALFDQPAFKNVIVNGIILAEDGAKMSKRLKNYPDPLEMVCQYGADAIRLYMLNSPAVRADDLCFCKQGVELVLRQVLLPLWNSYSFFITYARLYQWTPDLVSDDASEKEMDHWILSRLQGLIADVELGMDAYDLSRAVGPLVGFVDDLTDWYIRRCRRRFWADEDTKDRRDAFATLYTVLTEFCKVAAPFIPFVTDEIFTNLTRLDSVHLVDYPEVNDSIRDTELESEMTLVREAIRMGHSLRKEQRIKVRQPLPCAHLVSSNPEILALLAKGKNLIMEELNVKEILFSSDEGAFVHIRAKPNFRVLGKKVGKNMRQAQSLIQELKLEEIAQLRSGESVELILNDEPFTLQQEDVEIERAVQGGMVADNVGEITIVLDTEMDEELIREGLARELVNKLNTMRREAGLQVTDRIAVTIETTDLVQQAYKGFAEYICGEALVVELTFASSDEGTVWDLNGEQAKIALHRV